MATDAPATIRPLDQPGDLGWVVMAHGELYHSEFGWDATLEALIMQIVAEYAAGHDPGREAAWIAERDGERLGCVFCVAGETDDCAKLRTLLVHPSARGIGLGRRLVETAIRFAQDAGYKRIRLWTNHPLAAARHIYLECGFRLTAEEPHSSFGVDLVGQTYERELAPAVRPGSRARTRGRAPGRGGSAA